ncbi:thioredoxin family protein [Sulfurospirillum arcachonense]|uniref:thioredoxin family protein n=1 Tax=Sulfurospirillum arcachonense TaxID=57666 RepID=UPI00046833F7|nr:thioredoxin fold domain-containing protein [Sulfurospirillum arcachonense]
MFVFKNIFILLIFLNSFIFASSAELYQQLGYSTTYNEALLKAKKTNKPMMLVLSTKTCPWCRKLENQVLRRDNINKIVQMNFVGIGLDRDDDVYPKEFIPEVVPTVVFIDPHNQNVLFKSYGYKSKKDFIKILTQINKNYKKATK